MASIYSVYLFLRITVSLFYLFYKHMANVGQKHGRSSVRVRRYSGTWFATDLSTWPPFDKTGGIRYFVCQRELTDPDPRTGERREHIQFYVEFTNSNRYKEAQRLLGMPNCHLEAAREGADVNTLYCTKERSRVPGTEPLIWGTSGDRQPGDRNQQNRQNASRNGGNGETKPIDDCVDQLVQGATPKAIRQRFPKLSLLMGDKIERFHCNVNADRIGSERPVHVEVRWGPPGTGKSASCWKNNRHMGINEKYASEPWGPLPCWSKDSVYFRRGVGKWYDGYQGEPVIVCDDVVITSHECAKLLLAMMDRYVFRAEVKCSTVLAQWKHVVLTMNFHPKDMFRMLQPPLPRETEAAILDRITRITEFTGRSMRGVDPPAPYIEISDDEDERSVLGSVVPSSEANMSTVSRTYNTPVYDTYPTLEELFPEAHDRGEVHEPGPIVPPVPPPSRVIVVPDLIDEDD